MASLMALYLGLTNGNKNTGVVGKVGREAKVVVDTMASFGKPRPPKLAKNKTFSERSNNAPRAENATVTVDEDPEDKAYNDFVERQKEQVKDYDANASDEDMAL